MTQSIAQGKDVATSAVPQQARNSGGGTSLEHSRKQPLAQGHREEKDTAHERQGTPQRDTQEGAAPAYNKRPEAEGGASRPSRPRRPSPAAPVHEKQKEKSMRHGESL